ncbi:MAG: thiamine diphosphokinase [Candidatus Marinimicrobia bacterium]|nr:thiamine diphosphokinase [Candidatus Neomarinimicrobiota bacterium]
MGKPKEACLFLNGTVPDPAVLRQYCPRKTLRVAADGAYDYCLQLGFTPDVLIGDMDSVQRLPTTAETELIRDSDPDFGDLEKCLRYCREKSVSDLYIFGADGKMTDHFLINIVTLAQYAKTMRINIYTRDEQLHFLSAGYHQFRTRKAQRFSLLAMEAVSGLILEGALYHCPGGLLLPGSRGLGNSCTGTELGIRFDAGLLLFMTGLS